MKKSSLKSLIRHIIKESTGKLGEGQPIGGVKNDHDFDAGRQNVMKAVNVGESTGNNGCNCGSGLHSQWVNDAQGIPLCKVCSKCKTQKLSRYRPEILRGYDQSDVDEPIEPENEAIGMDGKYNDDMESGVAVKKLHGLDEADEESKESVKMNSLKSYHDVGVKCGAAQKNRDTGLVSHFLNWFNKAIILEKDGQYALQARREFNIGYKEGTGSPRPQYFKETETENDINEETGTGAVGGYSTPFAFSKKKGGSKRAMDVTTKMGYKKVKDID